MDACLNALKTCSYNILSLNPVCVLFESFPKLIKPFEPLNPVKPDLSFVYCA